MHFSAALVVYYTSDKRREALEFEESGFFFVLSVIWKSRNSSRPSCLSENQMQMHCPYRCMNKRELPAYVQRTGTRIVILGMPLMVREARRWLGGGARK